MESGLFAQEQHDLRWYSPDSCRSLTGSGGDLVLGFPESVLSICFNWVFTISIATRAPVRRAQIEALAELRRKAFQKPDLRRHQLDLAFSGLFSGRGGTRAWCRQNGAAIRSGPRPRPPDQAVRATCLGCPAVFVELLRALPSETKSPAPVAIVHCRQISSRVKADCSR